MKTLFEKLKPEILVLLEQEALLYPSSMEVLKNKLKEKHFWVELSIADASRLISMDKEATFSITGIINLFKEE
jgi:hypothetical protein